MVTSLAFPASRRARGLGMKTEYVRGQKNSADILQMKIAVMGQADASYSGSMAKKRVYTAAEVGTLYGFQSPLYLMCRSLLPVYGDGVGDIPVWVYPLTVTTGGQAAGTITPTCTAGGGVATKAATYWIKVNNRLSLPVNVAVGDDEADWIDKAVAALNAVYGMPGTASDGTTVLNYTSGWEGTNGNNIHLEVVSPDSGYEFTFVTVQPSAATPGTGTIDPSTASEGINLIGESWDTLIVSASDYDDSTSLDAFDTYGEGRWDPEVRKPCIAFTGCNEATLATVTAVTDARKTDRTNAIVVNPGSNDLPFVIAADHVRRIAVMANNIPSHDYGTLDLPELSPALDSVIWSSPQRDTAVKAGLSTIEVVDSEVVISDVVTCHHPTGEDPPAYSYVCDIIKLMNVIHNFNGEFDAAKWKGGPALVPNDQAVDPATGAKKPKDALAAMAGIYENLGYEAIITDPDYAIENSTADISSVNPKRLDIVAKFLLSGNANVIAITLQFSFYYGGR